MGAVGNTPSSSSSSSSSSESAPESAKMSESASDPATETTTLQPAAACPQDTAPLFLGSSVTLTDFYGMVAESSSTATCTAGKANCYPDSTLSVINSVDLKAVGQVSCANLCACQADGVCWTRTADDVSYILYPYCNAGVCSVYLGFASNTGAITTNDGSKTIQINDQINQDTLEYKPVTEDVFPKINSVSCDGCTAAKSC